MIPPSPYLAGSHGRRYREDYCRILERVTPDRVRGHFAGIVQGDFTRFELPHLNAVNFVMTRALRGGVTRSLALDAHGKSLSSLLLELKI